MSFTFKAQDKSNAKRFLVKTCKLENFEAYLTQHAGSWGTWLGADGKPVEAAKAVEGTFATMVVAAPAPAPVERAIAADVLPTEADLHAMAQVGVEQAQEEETHDEAPAPSASAFGAFALSQLTAEPQPDPVADPAAPKASREGATSTTGLKIEKDRPFVNGVQRQSKGSVGDRLWALYDSIGEGCTLLQAKAMAEAHGLSTTSAAIALYRWRKYNGFANVK